MQGIDFIFSILVLLASVIAHEVAHGYSAYLLGDPTAKMAGRLTWNPLSHIDWLGSIVIPAILFLTSAGVVFGWAKPVPYNPNNLRNRKWGTIAVALAGVVTNFTIAIVFSLLLKILGATGHLSEPIVFISSLIILTNILLGIFNLVPLPPLDGSRVLFALLPARLAQYEHVLERYSFPIFLIFVIFLWGHVAPIVTVIFKALTGFAL